MNEPDFIPKNDMLCQNCVYKEYCPETWFCKTMVRWYEYASWYEENIEYVRNGDSTEKVR